MINNFSLIWLLNSTCAPLKLHCVCDLCNEKHFMILQGVEVTLTLILHKFVITSAMPTDHLKEITNISHSYMWFWYKTLPLIGSYTSRSLNSLWILELHTVLMLGNFEDLKWQLNFSLIVTFSTL
jgi:hypothetical protein